MKKLLLTILIFLCAGCSNPDSTFILFLGDTSFGESYGNPYYEHSLKSFKQILADAELVVTNLETPLTDIEESYLEEEKSIIHYSDPIKSLETFLDNNMTVFSLANNHAMDFGTPGLQQTFDTGLTFFGAGFNEEDAKKPYIYKDILVLGAFEYRKKYDEDYYFYADEYKDGVNAIKPEQVKDLRNKYPEKFIIVFPHWGDNYKKIHSLQEQAAHDYIDAGADLILGHGAHMMQEIEQYKGKWIVYSLGNFVFNSKGRYKSMKADPFSLIASLEGRNLKLYPIFTDNTITGFQNRFVTEEEFNKIKGDFETGKDQYGYFIKLAN